MSDAVAVTTYQTDRSSVVFVRVVDPGQRRAYRVHSYSEGQCLVDVWLDGLGGGWQEVGRFYPPESFVATRAESAALLAHEVIDHA